MCFRSCSTFKISTFLGICSYGMHIFFTSFLCNSCNFQYFILGWPTLVLGPSYCICSNGQECSVTARVHLAACEIQPFVKAVIKHKFIHVDRGSLSTNHKLASQNSSNADVSTAGLQFSSGQTSMEENCSPAVETSAFDEFCEANLWLVEREPRST